jgi:lipopolysaccharide/colanic/teichoic acid biosynthesis glycosyltransferase
MSPFQEFIKRGFDVVGAFLALLLVSPLVVFVFLLAKLASRQPVFCQVKYYDLNDETFEAFQFRCSSGTDGNSHAASWIEQFLDGSSFNEILLLINVLRGDMSLVGPRPLTKLWAAAYRARLAPTRLRGLRPGLVSWAAVKERSDEVSSALERLHRNIADDCYYLANRSLWFDLKILILAIFSIRTYS